MKHTTGLGDLSRDELLAAAYEYMLSGLIMVKTVTPLLILNAAITPEQMTDLSIQQWMGASPVYTGRMRSLMGIEGDDVPAIMKALQLDVGFVHQYMDVRYLVQDATHGEFWLPHCGALLDVEPFGEEQVFNMCHTIEDPTFDATALATNPRARIRPLHRPPRIPVGRVPHCRWTLIIDEANEPVGPIPRTGQVRLLALAAVPNDRIGDRRDGIDDYAGSFNPDFKLGSLSSAALQAVAHEFGVQTHLLVASNELALNDLSSDPALARELQDEGWLATSWILAERLGRALELGVGIEAVGNALALTPMIPPGIDREISTEQNTLTCVFSSSQEGLLTEAHPGWAGSLARGVTKGIEGTARGLGMEPTSISVETAPNTVTIQMELEPSPTEATEPDSVALSRIGLTADWTFELV